MRHRSSGTTALIVISIIVLTLSVWAAWDDNGTRISDGERSEIYPRIAPDTAGGAYVAWEQQFVSALLKPSIFVQRIDEDGYLLWGSGGTMLTEDTTVAFSPVAIAPDGAGGALVAWSESRNSSSYAQDIYAQRLDENGSRLWEYWGEAVYEGVEIQNYPLIVSDGAGGGIIVWRDENYTASTKHLYAQRLDASGNRLWPVGGVRICTESADQVRHQLASDGAGGVIIVWDDDRIPSDHNVYAQRIDATGTVQWDPEGIPICTEVAQQTFAQLVSDDAGGAIITWEESSRDGLYAQHVNAGGDTLWAANGLVIYEYYVGGRTEPQIDSDGSGGAVLCWNDSRTPRGIYAQRIDADGNLLWNVDGVSICTAIATQYGPQIASDGNGGAAITWQENRNVSYLGDVYARTVDPYGSAHGPTTGSAVCANVDEQREIRIATNGKGGGIISWSDLRNATETASDIYAGRVTFSGATDDGLPESPSATYLSQNYPNPFNPSTTIVFGLEKPGMVSLQIYDVAGRLVSVLVDGEREALRYAETWNGRDIKGNDVVSGVYFYRLITPGFERTIKMTLIR